jgi:hypothetical protein
VSEFLHSLLSFIVDNMEKFQTNSDIRNINTWYQNALHQPSDSLTSYKKAAYDARIKLLKPALKYYLCQQLQYVCIYNYVLKYIVQSVHIHIMTCSTSLACTMNDRCKVIKMYYIPLNMSNLSITIS